MTETKEFYVAAIAELEVYIAREDDDAKGDAAQAKIEEYERMIREGAFDDILQRTPQLRKLMNELSEITATASKTPTISGQLNKIDAFVQTIAPLADGGNDEGEAEEATESGG